MEEVVQRIAEYTAARGHEVHVITYNRLRTGGKGALPREEWINGVHVIRLKPNLTWSHGTYSRELPEVLRKLKPDLVHVHVWRHPHVIQVARLRREMGFKAILHGHAPFHKLNQVGPITWTYYKLVDTTLRSILKNYDTYIALTKHEAETIRRMGLEEDKIMVIPNGINQDQCILSNEREDMVLYLGRISKVKNIELLVKAAKYIKHAQLVIAGPDEGLINTILQYAGKHNIEVKYLGAVSEEKKHELYLKAKAYALPSIYEPFGITLLEAGIHATPSVITGNGGQVYAAPPGKASLWAEPKPEKYAEAIIQLLTDQELHRRLSQGALQHAEQHLWSKILPRYEEIYG
ncbi:glycosyltransferase family 4 protein [Caldivirga maquilingensis]|uniref:glycosyltransferase family 4 protein n=1 Tax=Caldivirga maquilingensis TaxID=76887 RepID=UPI001E4919AC|nr:glycosyltransferase family 4 protein [Caldivirga maquilingensis]